MKSFKAFINEANDPRLGGRSSSGSKSFWIKRDIVIDCKDQSHEDYVNDHPEKLQLNSSDPAYQHFPFGYAISQGWCRVFYVPSSQSLAFEVANAKQIPDIIANYEKMGIRRVRIASGGIANTFVKSPTNRYASQLVTEQRLNEALAWRSYWVKGDRVEQFSTVSHAVYARENRVKMGLPDVSEHKWEDGNINWYRTAIAHGWTRVMLMPLDGLGTASISFDCKSPSQLQDIKRNYHKMGITRVVGADGDIDDKFVDSNTSKYVASQLVTESKYVNHHQAMTTTDSNMVLLKAVSQYKAKKLSENNDTIVYRCDTSDNANKFADVWMAFRAIFPFMTDLTVDGKTVTVHKGYNNENVQ